MSNAATPLYSNRAHALAYAKHGWPVFPLHEALGGGTCTCGKQCGNPGKHPRTRNGLKAATTDPAQINSWWTETPDAPIGIVCGSAANLLVIDIDPRNGGNETWDRLVAEHGPLVTVRSKTGGGGEHLYVRAPATPLKSRGNALGPGVDISSEGHYIIAPPSMHASGSRYEFAPCAGPGDIDLAQCPQWVIDLASKPTRKTRAARDAADTRGWLAVAFESAGWLGEWSPTAHAWFARCPWQHEHSDGRGDGKDSSTIVYPPDADHTMGWWRCEHAHCAHRFQDAVREALPDAARAAANRRYPPQRDKPTHVTHDPETGEVPPDWREELLRKDGSLISCMLNAALILTHDAAWQGTLVWDTFAERYVWAKSPPWAADTDAGSASPVLTDEDSTRLSLWLHKAWFIKIPPDSCWKILQVIGKRTEVHPVRDYLTACESKWDATQRLPTMAQTYFGASDTPYHRAVMLRWMIAAVARIYSPGCRSDCVLILEGDQGKRKSSALALLASDPWFCDDIGDIRNKDAADALRGKWIAELAELASVKRADTEPVKAFLSRRVDHFRPAYGRLTIDRPRSCVFAGTTNSSEYQTDPTGLRRFWAVYCAGTIDLEALARDRDLLWGEAVVRYKSGEQWWLTQDEEPLQIAEQAERREDHPWTEQVIEWCDAQLGAITVDRILADCIGLKLADRGMVEARIVGSILRSNGFKVIGKHGPKGAQSKRWGRP